MTQPQAQETIQQETPQTQTIIANLQLNNKPQSFQPIFFKSILYMADKIIFNNSFIQKQYIETIPIAVKLLVFVVSFTCYIFSTLIVWYTECNICIEPNSIFMGTQTSQTDVVQNSVGISQHYNMLSYRKPYYNHSVSHTFKHVFDSILSHQTVSFSIQITLKSFIYFVHNVLSNTNYTKTVCSDTFVYSSYRLELVSILFIGIVYCQRVIYYWQHYSRIIISINLFMDVVGQIAQANVMRKCVEMVSAKVMDNMITMVVDTVVAIHENGNETAQDENMIAYNVVGNKAVRNRIVDEREIH